MFDAIPCNISETAGFAFRKNTGSRQESLLGGVIVALNYQWERRQLIDMLREGKAQGGSGLSKKEKKISANQKKVSDCILIDRHYIHKEIVDLIDNATAKVYDGEKENRS